MIEVNHLTKKYGNHIAVNDLSFQVQKGQIFGFLGPNGAGKSTTMNILTGYLGASLGEIKINGFDIYKDSNKAKKNIGYLPEIPPLYENMTVLEYLKFVAELKGISKKERNVQINEVMELTKVVDMKNRLIQNLSKGYKQRVGLAQAVLGYPEVIILDEPTVGLDPKQIIEIRELIKELGKKHTVILSSHILTEISAVCDHVMIIANGKLVASDTPDNLTKIMQGKHKIEVILKTTKEDAEKAIREEKLFQDCEIHFAMENEYVKLTLEVLDDANIREEMFYFFAKHKMPILELKNTLATLEDVYLEVTQKQNLEKIDETESETETESQSEIESQSETETETESQSEIESQSEDEERKGAEQNAGNL